MGQQFVKMANPTLSIFLLFLMITSGYTWCTSAGGVGEHSKKCYSSVDFEACFATCQCYDANDNPTHKHDAICLFDECFCVFDACPYGRLASSPICCTKGSGNMITC